MRKIVGFAQISQASWCGFPARQAAQLADVALGVDRLDLSFSWARAHEPQACLEPLIELLSGIRVQRRN